MGFIDILLFPVYIFLFHLVFAYSRKKIKDPKLKFYHKYAFWVKIFASFCMTIFNVYISPGDSTNLYYIEGHNLARHILADADNIQWLFKTGKEYPVELIKLSGNTGYFGSESNVIIIKLVAIFSFLSFGRYIIINLFFSMLALSGIWKLFLFFYDSYPHLHKHLSMAILFLPTVVFWSSGALKDPVCMAMLGWFTYSMYKGFYKKKDVMLCTGVAIVSTLVLFTVKPYILFAYIPFFLLYLFLINMGLIKNYFVKFFAFVVIGGLSMLGFVSMSSVLQEEMGNLSLDNLAGTVESHQSNFAAMANRAESSFSLGVEFDGTMGSLAAVAPAAINATLFRPYIWESKKISTLLSSLESLTLMIFFLYVLFKVGIFKFFGIILKDPMVMFCFFFAILFALFVGATTLNFGTLVRYKIPCMPFFTIALILIYQKGAKQKTKTTVAVTEEKLVTT
ncbi:MAG: hypothetical protein EOO03_11755 [Chitinophagaceae bacterium]|nr:MAG: hypothetical protein EOO03_11755 [Chitinophagaceae bacterium]